MSPDSALDTRTGAVLFTDLVGFTAFNEAKGDAAALNVLDQQTRLARSVTAAFDDARIVKELGDGLMLWFATAADGLVGSARLAGAVRAARSEGFPLAVRMGLHFGDAVARGDDLVGQTVNIAARVAALAGPSELLVSDAVVDECGDGLDPSLVLSPVGPTSVKGVREPIWLRRLA